MIKQICISFLILGSLVSCHRKAIHKEHPEFIGSWFHHDENGEKWYIDISDKSLGVITVYDEDGDDQTRFGENPNRWRYIEEKKLLTLRLIPDKFHVDQLPIEASALIINERDTIQPVQTYCVIDGNYYLKND